MLNKLTIGRRLVLAFTLIMGLMILISFLGFRAIGTFDQDLSSSLKASAAYSTAADTARYAQVTFKKQVQEWKDMLLRGFSAADMSKYRHNFDRDEKKVNDLLLNLKGQLQKLHVDTAKVDDLLLSHAELGRRYRAAIANYDPADPLSNRQVDSLVRGMDRPPTDKMDALVEMVRKLQEAKLVQSEAAGGKEARYLGGLILFSLLAGVLLSLLLAFRITRSITKPLRQTIKVIEQIARGDTSGTLPVGKPVNCSEAKNCGKQDCPSYGKEDPCWVTSGSLAVIKHCPEAIEGGDCRGCDIYGARTELEELGGIIASLSSHLAHREELALGIAQGDLTKEVKLASDQDALGRALQAMLQSLRTIIGEVQGAGTHIASGAEQVSDASQSLSQGATEQAGSLEEITASIQDLASRTRHNAENATQAQQLSTGTQTAAEEGNRQMEHMVRAMTEISDSSQSISRIIKVIDEIAFQTNLLALNAAVEAARAGQHGKGFAVVAEEVRNLAARSAQAAKETAELIEGSVRKTQNGTEIATRTAQALEGIMQSVTKTNDLVGEIAAASNEQAEGIAQINQGLGQIDQVTQQNTANAEQSAAAAEELASQAAHLKQLLQSFRLQRVSGREIPVVSQPQTTPPRKLAPPAWPAENISAATAARPAPAIALDDEEFGRY